MEQLLSLEKLGDRLRKVDMLVVALLKRRMDLALQVVEVKVKNGQKIFRAQTEARRLAQVRAEARKLKLNPHFVESILYSSINESCKQQMIQLQSMSARRHKEQKNEEDLYCLLKKNLLILTKRWSDSYDDHYDKAFFATQAYLKFEEQLLEQEIKRIDNCGLALDLGCATGRLVAKLSPLFKQVVGYDISPHMLMKANAKKRKYPNISFIKADLEKGIPQSDSSVSFVAMNLGTASDVSGICKVIKEVKRVLHPGGRFLFSFYNRDALLYQWDFIPWPVGLAAEININKHCLDVHLGAKVLSVYARPYTTEEVRKLFPPRMRLSKVLTYPTISSILPNDLFEGKPSIQKSMIMIDCQLAKAHDGAYIIAIGQKK